MPLSSSDLHPEEHCILHFSGFFSLSVCVFNDFLFWQRSASTVNSNTATPSSICNCTSAWGSEATAPSMGLPGVQWPHLTRTLVAGSGERGRGERSKSTLCFLLLVSLSRRV